jgi:nucleoside 2-deoxyribosyltransferase
MPKVLVILPLTPDFDDVYAAIIDAALRASDRTGVKFVVSRSQLQNRSMYQFDREYIDSANIVVADISCQHPSVIYELGYTDGIGKPVIIIQQADGHIYFDVLLRPTVIYDRSQLQKHLVLSMSEEMAKFNANPLAFLKGSHLQADSEREKPTAFVSYSHADRDCLERLQVHLRPIVREGLVQIMADTEIKAGEKWKERITSALNRAAIAVLLISADFLASDFIVDNELPPLLAAAEERGTVIIPLILKPCRFERDDHLSCFQAINSPKKPLLMLNAVEQEELYSKVAERIEKELRARPPNKPLPPDS